MRDTGSLLNDVAHVVSQVGLNQDVARVQLLLDFAPFARRRTDFRLRRHEDASEQVAHVSCLGHLLDAGLDLILFAGQRVDHIPLFVHHMLPLVVASGRRLAGTR